LIATWPILLGQFGMGSNLDYVYLLGGLSLAISVALILTLLFAPYL